MEEKRKIAVVTGARSEYGILKPLLKAIGDSARLELNLMVTGMHLLRKYGLTIKEIKKDGFKIRAEIPMYAGDGSADDYLGQALARGIKGFTAGLIKIKPDIVVVLGDRLESLAAALAANILNIPIAHIHGGDKSDSGHIDESTRHSISKMAHIHFPPTEKCKDRLFKMGEEVWRIHQVGTLGLDSIVNRPVIKKEELFRQLDLTLTKKVILCLFHPVHLEAESAAKQMSEILKVLLKLKIQTVIIYPNNDAGSRGIISEINQPGVVDFIKVFPSLPHNEYVSLLKYADVLIGNSSSGIIEAPSLKLPVVNIGIRNVGREHGVNVIFTKVDQAEIAQAIKRALYNRKFKAKVAKAKNPWGQGGTSAKIVKILENIKIDKKLLLKILNY